MTNNIPTVVVIDDSYTSLSLYQRSSELLNINLETFSSPSKSLIYLGKHSVDLVFLDIVMRDMDGLAMLKTLHDMGLHERTAIVVVTSKDYAQDRVLAQQLGSCEYLVKPLRSQEIREVICRYVAPMQRSIQGLSA